MCELCERRNICSDGIRLTHGNLALKRSLEEWRGGGGRGEYPGLVFFAGRIATMVTMVNSGETSVSRWLTLAR